MEVIGHTPPEYILHTAMSTQKREEPIPAKLVKPNFFEPETHWVRKAYQNPIDPIVKCFLELDTSMIVKRYCLLHPTQNKEVLETCLAYQPKYFQWAGADLMKVTTKEGQRKMVIIENNSCPSGQKYMPLVDEQQGQGGYRTFLERTFETALEKRELRGELAVIYDKNPIETSGYAHAMADIFNEKVHFVSAYDSESSPAFEFRDGIMHVFGEDKDWHPIRAAFRYVTKRPWNRLPISSKTLIVNPPIVCLAGGRNKLLAAKAYNGFNREFAESGLAINTPITVCDVHKNDIPMIVERMGGQVVIKVPYNNAGQGVFIIKNNQQLQDFLNQNHPYDLFIVQEFISAYNSKNNNNVQGKLHHIGTVPTDEGSVYVADARMMISATSTGLKPIGMYSRRAARPIYNMLDEGTDTDENDAYMTNLSFRNPDGSWTSDIDRVMRYDSDGFYKLGLGLDDLIEAYLQTVFSTIAIDRMAQALVDENGQFRSCIFQSLNDDPILLSEIMK